MARALEQSLQGVSSPPSPNPPQRNGQVTFRALTTPPARSPRREEGHPPGDRSELRASQGLSQAKPTLYVCVTAPVLGRQRKWVWVPRTVHRPWSKGLIASRRGSLSSLLPSRPLIPAPAHCHHLPGPTRSGIHLHGHQHLVLGRAEVVALGQEDLPEGSLAQFSLQHDVPPLDVLHICGGDREEVARSVLPSLAA